VISAGGDFDPLGVGLSDDTIDKAMLASDAARPPFREIAFQRFRFPDAVERIATSALDEFVDPSRRTVASAPLIHIRFSLICAASTDAK
jgi:hypothetical protein